MMKPLFLAAALSLAIAPAALTTPALAQTQPGALTAAEFISKAAVSNMFEIQSSKLVIDRGQGTPPM